MSDAGGPSKQAPGLVGLGHGPRNSCQETG